MIHKCVFKKYMGECSLTVSSHAINYATRTEYHTMCSEKNCPIWQTYLNSIKENTKPEQWDGVE